MAQRSPDPLDEEKKALGDRMRRLREALGVPQHQIAEVLGIAQSGVSDRERGETWFETADLIKLSRLFHRSIGTLFGEGSLTLEDAERLDKELTTRLQRLGTKDLEVLSAVAQRMSDIRTESVPTRVRGPLPQQDAFAARRVAQESGREMRRQPEQPAAEESPQTRVPPKQRASRKRREES